MIQRSNLVAACCALALVLAAAPASLRAQGAGPMAAAGVDEVPGASAAQQARTARRCRPTKSSADSRPKKTKWFAPSGATRFRKTCASRRSAPTTSPPASSKSSRSCGLLRTARLYEKPVSRQPSTLHYSGPAEGRFRSSRPGADVSAHDGHASEIRNHLWRQAAARRVERLLFHQ